MQKIINAVIEYAKNNLVLVGIIAACVLLMVIALIAVCVASGKKKKQAKKLAVQQATVLTEEPAKEEPVPVEEATVKTEETVVTEEEPTPVAEEEPVVEEQPVVEEAPIAEETPIVEEPAKEETPAPTPKKKAPAKKPTQKAEEPKKPAEKKPLQKEEPKATVEKKPTEKKPAVRYAGKWVVCHLVLEDENGAEAEGAYFFELRASNGELLLSSEEYTSYSGALAGIETHKANVEKGNFKITLSKKGDYIFKLLSGKNTLLCTGANYPTIARAESAVESTKRFAKTAVLQEAMEEIRVKAPVEDASEDPVYDESITGKWIINAKSDLNGNKVYYFELFASNGEKLLSSEEYTTYVGAVNGIATHKANIEKDKFRISVTKRGDYIFKLLNGNGQLLCLGEHYKTKHRCASAVESVKRFAKNSSMYASPDINE